MWRPGEKALQLPLGMVEITIGRVPLSKTLSNCEVFDSMKIDFWISPEPSTPSSKVNLRKRMMLRTKKDKKQKTTFLISVGFLSSHFFTYCTGT